VIKSFLEKSQEVREKHNRNIWVGSIASLILVGMSFYLFQIWNFEKEKSAFYYDKFLENSSFRNQFMLTNLGVLPENVTYLRIDEINKSIIKDFFKFIPEYKFFKTLIITTPIDSTFLSALGAFENVEFLHIQNSPN